MAAENIIEVKGLVLREVNIGEADKLLTVLTSEYGKLTVRAYGARSLKSRLINIARIMSYSTMQLRRKPSGSLSIKDADLGNGFFELYSRLEGLTLGQYFITLCDELTGEDMPDDGMLSLTLNALYAINTRKYPDDMVKAAYELRAMAQCGYRPETDACGVCGNALSAENAPYLVDAPGGCLLCRECAEKRKITEAVRVIPAPMTSCELSCAAYEAVRHTLDCPVKRLFAFRLDEKAASEYTRACELYSVTHIGRELKPLKFYKTLLGNI